MRTSYKLRLNYILTNWRVGVDTTFCELRAWGTAYSPFRWLVLGQIYHGTYRGHRKPAQLSQSRFLCPSHTSSVEAAWICSIPLLYTALLVTVHINYSCYDTREDKEKSCCSEKVNCFYNRRQCSSRCLCIHILGLHDET